MDAVARLTAIEDIKQLKARYFLALDSKDWQAYGDVFTDDARIDVRGAITADEDDNATETASDFDDAGLIIGGKAMADFAIRFANDLVSVHQGYLPIIEIVSASEARGIWAMEDRLWYPKGTAEFSFLNGFGHYHETYVKTADKGWRIASMKLTRLRVITLA
ncbi:MAG: nuclear transport factor 2 family protein [Sphingomonadales bacterium]